MFVGNDFGGEEMEGHLLHHWGRVLGALVDMLFKISEDNNVRFGAVRIAILVGFDNENTHGWNDFGDLSRAV